MKHRDIALAMYSVGMALEFPEYCKDYALSRAHDALHQLFKDLPEEDMLTVDDMLMDLIRLRHGSALE